MKEQRMNERIAALNKERIALHQEAGAAIEKAEAEERGLTPEERERDDVIAERIGEIDAEITTLTRHAERERGYKEAQGRAVRDAVEGARTPQGENDDTERQTDAPTPFRHFGEQLAAVAAAAQQPHATDERLLQIQAATGASETVGSEGGFLVQQDFQAGLLRLVHQTGVLKARCDNTGIGANSNGLKINAVDETSRVDGSRQGGILAYWTSEAGTLTKSKPTYRQMELSLNKLTGLYYATDELLMDTSALGQEISSAFAEEFGFKIDDAIMRGSGSGQPLGIIGHAGTVSIAKETGQTAATIMKKNIEKMYARMWAPSVARAEWFINQDCWPQLFELSQTVGVGGVPVFLPSNSMAAAPFGTLLGRPIQPIEQCSTLGTVGDIVFADFSQYKTIDKGGIDAATSIHVQFLTDELTFRFILRMDGQPKRNAALTPYKGTNTLSSFITLATRS